MLTRSGTIGRSYLVPAGGIGLTFAGFLVRYRARLDADPRFIRYAVQSTPAQDQIQAAAITSTIQNFNAERYANLDLWAPALSEQRRIADFLDDQVGLLDRAIALRHLQVALMDEVERGRLTSTYETLSETFGTVRLGTLLLGLEQGWSPQCEDRVPEDSEYGVLKAGCVNGGEFHHDAVKALPSQSAPRTQYEINPGDFLMSRASGSLDLIGSAAIVPTDVREKVLLCDKIYRLQLSSACDPDLLALLLRAHPVREAIKLGTSGAEGMANNLPSGTVRGLRIPAAPLERQQQESKDLMLALNENRHLRALAVRSTTLIQERKQALITAAVTGQFDVTTARSVA